MDTVETMMKDVLLSIICEATAAARLPRSMKQKVYVDVVHKRLMYQGRIIDQCMADKVMALVLWDTARGRDMQETIISAMGNTNDNSWYRLLSRL